RSAPAEIAPHRSPALNEMSENWRGLAACQGLQRAGYANERAAVIERQIREIVREVREVVADPELQVLAQVARDHEDAAAAPVVQIRHLHRAAFDHALPALEEAEVGPQHEQVRRIVEERGIVAREAHLADPVRVLAADGPA